MTEETPQQPFQQPQESKRVSPTPKNELDFQMMNTDPAWGTEYIPEELKNKLTTQETEVMKQVAINKIDVVQIQDAKIQLINQGFIETDPETFMLKQPSEWTIIKIEPDGVMTTTKYTKVIKKDTMWAIHGYYTRDLRLGNLRDSVNPFIRDEIKYCEYHLNLAGDYLNFKHPELKHGFYKAFFAHIRRVATLLELSQSRGGWFRKTGTTITTALESNKPIEQAAEEKRIFGIATGGNRK